ncbi:hypothetical protein VVD49_15670 [Uliginosibacterium sp. H3]|uniref:Transcriptional regulator n=1 Tax=Uliginosibacterium silvisoli TaxID=3114758 RepID=A0ABU6K5J2_9RHOO|nr:hypothetical protein [Uliginosibacterium sp. H3]
MTREEVARELGLTVNQVDYAERCATAKALRILERRGFTGKEPLLGSLLRSLMSEQIGEAEIV